MNAAVLLVFARAIGFLARAPGLGRANVPPALRAGLAFALGLAIAPGQPRVAADFATLVALFVSEAFVGAILGLGASLVAEAAAGAGRLLDDLVGLRASIPGIAVAPAGFGGLWSLVFVVAAFALGGIDVLIVAFAHSFSVIPLGSGLDPAMLERFGLGYPGAFAGLAFELALPAIIVALAVHLAVAGLGRVLARFGNLTLGFPAAYAGVVLAGFASLAFVRDLAERPAAGLSFFGFGR